MFLLWLLWAEWGNFLAGPGHFICNVFLLHHHYKWYKNPSFFFGYFELNEAILWRVVNCPTRKWRLFHIVFLLYQYKWLCIICEERHTFQVKCDKKHNICSMCYKKCETSKAYFYAQCWTSAWAVETAGWATSPISQCRYGIWKKGECIRIIWVVHMALQMFSLWSSACQTSCNIGSTCPSNQITESVQNCL